MTFFSSDEANLPPSKLAEELAEQELYSRAAVEVASGRIRHGLWAKAKAMSGGGEEATKVAYLKLRVEMMRTESDAVAHATGELAKELHQADERENRERKAWRRGRDSNPRYVAVYTLSRRAPSTTRPPLRARGV